MIGGGIARMRGALVVAEIAAAVVLLSAAGLLIRSFVALQNVTMGFRPENVLVLKTNMAAAPPAVRQFFRDVMPQIAALPGVSASGATNALPGHVQSMGPYFFDRMPPKVELASAPSTAITILAPGAFAALGIPLGAGRDFDDRDTADGSPVAIVNESLVRKSLAGENPIGRQVDNLDSGTGHRSPAPYWNHRHRRGHLRSRMGSPRPAQSRRKEADFRSCGCVSDRRRRCPLLCRLRLYGAGIGKRTAICSSKAGCRSPIQSDHSGYDLSFDPTVTAACERFTGSATGH